jgi:hypothetical protein
MYFSPDVSPGPLSSPSAQRNPHPRSTTTMSLVVIELLAVVPRRLASFLAGRARAPGVALYGTGPVVSRWQR